MKKIILAAICSAAIGALSVAPVSAQTTGPAGQDSTKMGTEMSKDGMKKGSTTGMSNDTMSKDGMKKDSMKKDGMKKDGMSDGMKK